MVSSELLPGPLLLRPDRLLRDDLPSNERKQILNHTFVEPTFNKSVS